MNKIAPEICGHRSTIYREIKRNGFEDDELPELNSYYGVVAQLKIGRTPEQIAGRLGHNDQPIRVSHKTIYAYVFNAEGKSEKLARQLPSRRKKRQPRYARRPRGQVFPPDRSIHEGPDYVKTRETFGELEGDLMIFERVEVMMNVASLVERKTRFADQATELPYVPLPAYP